MVTVCSLSFHSALRSDQGKESTRRREVKESMRHSMQNRFSRRISAPEFLYSVYCSSPRRRGPSASQRLDSRLRGNERKTTLAFQQRRNEGKKEAERRQTCLSIPPHLAMRRAPRVTMLPPQRALQGARRAMSAEVTEQRLAGVLPSFFDSG